MELGQLQTQGGKLDGVVGATVLDSVVLGRTVTFLKLKALKNSNIWFKLDLKEIQNPHPVG